MSESAIQNSDKEEDDDDDFYIDSSDGESSEDDEDSNNNSGSNHFADAVVDLPIPHALKQFILYYRTNPPVYLPPPCN